MPGNRVQPIAFTEEVSRIGGSVQRIFGTDWFGKEPGAVPGSGQAQLSERRTNRTDRSSDVSDVAGCDAGGADRDPGAKPDPARGEPGGKLSGVSRDAIEDRVSGG